MLSITTRSLSLIAIAALLGILALAACGGGGAATPAEPAAPPAISGDAANGEALFVANGCAGCHATTDQQLVGPGMAGVMAGKGPYGDKLPNGKPITDASAAEWIKIGGVGKIGQMPGFNTLTDQELADLVAYLKTLE